MTQTPNYSPPIDKLTLARVIQAALQTQGYINPQFILCVWHGEPQQRLGVLTDGVPEVMIAEGLAQVIEKLQQSDP